MLSPMQRLDVPVSVLGEGPVWSERDERLYFVDIVSKRVQAYRPATKEYTHWQFDELTGSLGECKSGGLVVALKDRIVWFDPSKGLSTTEPLVVLERDRPENRLNDGKVDPWGRFWVGSMRVDETGNAGRLWCVTADRKATLHRDGIGISNSIAFDKARSRMYFADSHARTIEQSRLDDEHMPTQWTPFSKLRMGSPDGSCVDAQGCLWNAEWLAWRLVRYAPDGEVDRVIEVPASRPTCCTFGGRDYKTLFVTSAQHKMAAQEKQQERTAGSLYQFDFQDSRDVQGLPADLFAM